MGKTHAPTQAVASSALEEEDDEAPDTDRNNAGWSPWRSTPAGGTASPAALLRAARTASSEEEAVPPTAREGAASSRVSGVSTLRRESVVSVQAPTPRRRIGILHLDTERLWLTVLDVSPTTHAQAVARYARPCAVAFDLEEYDSVRPSTLSHALLMIETLLVAAAHHHALVLALATRALAEAPGLDGLLRKLDAWYDVRVEVLTGARGQLLLGVFGTVIRLTLQPGRLRPWAIPNFSSLATERQRSTTQ